MHWFPAKQRNGRAKGDRIIRTVKRSEHEVILNLPSEVDTLKIVALKIKTISKHSRSDKNYKWLSAEGWFSIVQFYGQACKNYLHF